MSKRNQYQSRSDLISKDQKRIAGVQQYMSNLPSVTVGGLGRAPGDLVTLFEGRISKAQAVDQKRSELSAAVKAEADSLRETNEVVRAFDHVVLAMYSGMPDVLAVFGLAPPKPRTTDSLTQAASTLKRVATHRARHPKVAETSPVVLAPEPVAPPPAGTRRTKG